MRKFLLFPLFIIFIHCGLPEGDFGWAVVQGKQDILEQKLHVVTDYKMMRDDLIFSPEDTIYVVYRFKTRLVPVGGDIASEYYLALYKKSLSYVETDLKRLRYEKDSGSLKTSFENLEVGEYLIKVATDDGEMFDSVAFEILPDEGYAVNQEFDDSEKDEIIRYSKN